MQNKFYLHQSFIAFISLACVILLTSCASSKQTLPGKFHPQALMQKSANAYLQKAQTESGPDSRRNKLNAITVLLINNHLNAAHQLIKTIEFDDLNSQNQAYYRIVQAFLNLNLNKPKQALQSIRHVSVNDFADQDRSRRLLYHQIALLCFQRNHKIVQTIKHSIAVSSLNANQDKDWLQTIWLQLQRLSVTTLKHQSNKANDADLKAWFQLALIIRQYNTSPQLLAHHLQKWQQQHPQHAANQLLPESLTAKQVGVFKPNKIAILLPQSGQYQNMADAVRNGLLTAIKRQQSQPDISFYDTSKQPIAQVYKKALNDGADMIIGPLTKPHVKALAQQDIPVPTVALNYASSSPQSRYLLEFGLSPQHSAHQSASSAWKRGANNFLVIQSPGTWFDNVNQAFQSYFVDLGGQINEQLTLKDNKKLQIAQALNVNQSQVRAHYIRNILKEKPIYTPRRRQDIHGIFLLTPPETARQVNPLIKFYYAGDLPIYSTSLINDDQKQPHKNSDLDPIHFSDLRWILNSHYTAVKKQMKNNWPQSYQKYRRLYAIGYDAYTIGQHINYFNMMPHSVLPGVSGPLYADGQKIHQQLALGRFHNGQVKFLSE